MRYVRLFFLHFQQAFALRSRSFVWFLISLFNPLTFYIFWVGAYSEKGQVIPQWTLANITVYYIVLVIAEAFLIVHIEEDVARWDIQEGRLSRYILKPFSYIAFKFFEEIPWRLIQGAFGIVAFFIFRFLLGNFLSISLSPSTIILVISMWIFAYALSFLYKMILGLSALWITDYAGLQQVSEVFFFIFAGLLMPIEFLPGIAKTVANLLPFAYTVYYPIVALQGKLPMNDLVRILGIQLAWIAGLTLVLRFMWKKGITLFTGIGQ